MSWTSQHIYNVNLSVSMKPGLALALRFREETVAQLCTFAIGNNASTILPTFFAAVGSFLSLLMSRALVMVLTFLI
jgi:hypothetical protein